MADGKKPGVDDGLEGTQVGPKTNDQTSGPYADLYDNPNPFSAGSPPVDGEQSSAFPQGGPPAYFVPLPPSAAHAGNPWSQGIPAREDEAASRAVADALDAKYASTLGYQSGGTDIAPTLHDYRVDEGLDDQFVPLDQRR